MLVSTGMKQQQTKTFSIDQIGSIADEVLEMLKNTNIQDNATILALSGDLGAGKTTLSQNLARRLGVEHNVISPTFVIMKSYPTGDGRFANLIHIDAYRLDSHTELERLGWQDMISDPKNLILIEWPERVEAIIPVRAHKIFLSHKSENEREIRY